MNAAWQCCAELVLLAVTAVTANCPGLPYRSVTNKQADNGCPTGAHNAATAQIPARPALYPHRILGPATTLSAQHCVTGQIVKSQH